MPTLNVHSRLFLIGILLFVSQGLFSVNTEISFRRITINDGLSLSSVYNIFQDSKGFMWFATEDGLNKYDGNNFNVYNYTPGNLNSLSYKWIESIVEDNRGNLWLGSRKGLSMLDPGTDKVIRYNLSADANHQLINDTIVSLAFYEDYIWVGTMTGLNRIHSETGVSEPIALESQEEESIVYFFHIDRVNNLWIGTGSGLYINYPGKDKVNCILSTLPHNNERLEAHAFFSNADTIWIGGQKSIIKYILDDTQQISFKYPGIQIPSPSSIERIYQDSNKNLWVQTAGGLQKLLSNKLVTIIKTPGLPPSLAILPRKPLIEDQEGNIWLGTFGNGIYRINGDDQQIIHLLHNTANPTSLSDNTINFIFEDRAKGIWFGTFGAGISVYDPNSNIIKTLQHTAFDSSSMSSSFVWSVQEDKEGRVWIGTKSTGINIYNPANETFTFISHEPSIPGSLQEGAVRKVFMSNDGSIWVGTDGGGLSKYDPQKKIFHIFTNDPHNTSTISSNSVRTIYEDTTGILWIGTRNGLNRLNPETEKFQQFVHNPSDEKSISNSFVYSAIYMDKRGFLWVGTYGGGLNKMDVETGEFIHYRYDPNDPSSISDDIIFSIYEDEKGYFWIGTNSGLNLFNPSTGKFKRYGTESGLPNEVIYGILPDINKLWMTTNKGISRLDLTEFRFKNYDVSDGLQSNEFNGGAFHKGASGLIYAGGVYGLSIIDPEKMVPVKNNAEMIISRLEILGKEVKVLQEGMFIDSPRKEDALMELVENYYLPKHVTYLDVVKLNYRQRYFSIEFSALNHHMPEKLNYRYRLENLEEHWTNAGSRNYVTYASLKPGTYIFEADAINSDGYPTLHPAELKIIITPPFWRSYWFMLLMGILAMMVIIFIYRYLLNQRTNNILKAQNEQIRAANNQLQISETNLKALNATKDKFFSIISHDLKNPFASVLSISELIDNNFESTNTDELKDGVAKIHKTNKHIYELLENLLTWSKTQRGSISIDKVKFNLSKIIETNINILKLSAEKKNLTIQNETSDNIFAFGDREMISTVVRNLLNNAVKFTPSGKNIRIITSRDKNIITVKISDEGVGISPENQHRLFSIEDKYKTEGTGGEKGTGLGLIICKEFVEENDGIIDVSSIPGRGSTFIFTIPSAE